MCFFWNIQRCYLPVFNAVNGAIADALIATHMNDGFLRLVIVQDEKCVSLEVKFSSWFWLKCGISRLHFTQTSIQMWKWGGQTENDWSIKRHCMLFCRCQFVINAKWQDQRHIFETKKLLLEIIIAKDSSGPWDHGVLDGWLIIIIEKPFARPASTAKRHVYVFSVCLTWGKN